MPSTRWLWPAIASGTRYFGRSLITSTRRRWPTSCAPTLTCIPRCPPTGELAPRDRGPRPRGPRRDLATHQGHPGTAVTTASFADARALEGFAGAAPVTRASGRSISIVRRTVKNNRLAAVGFVWAFAAIPRPGPAKTHYDHRRTTGDRHAAALRNTRTCAASRAAGPAAARVPRGTTPPTP